LVETPLVENLIQSLLAFEKKQTYSSNILIIQRMHCATRNETDKSTRLTDGAFGIAEKPLDIIRDSRHLYEVVLIEPPDVFLVEVASNRQNGFAL
jgi:hypothetical protein